MLVGWGRWGWWWKDWGAPEVSNSHEGRGQRGEGDEKGAGELHGAGELLGGSRKMFGMCLG